MSQFYSYSISYCIIRSTVARHKIHTIFHNFSLEKPVHSIDLAHDIQSTITQHSEVINTKLEEVFHTFKGYVAQQTAGQKHGRQIPMWSAREQCRYIQIAIYKRVPKATGEKKERTKKEKKKLVVWLRINTLCSTQLSWGNYRHPRDHTGLPETLRLTNRT